MASENDLFITEEVYGTSEKLAMTKLSRDPTKWEQEILDDLQEQNAFVQDYPLRFHLNKSDPDFGMGVGQIVVNEKVAVPVVVEEFELHPLDLFWYDGKLHPLTKESLAEAVRPGPLGVPVEPGEGELADVSLYGAMRVPFSGKYSFGEALSFTMDDLEKAIAVLGKEGTDYALRTNGALKTAVAKYATACDRRENEAASRAAAPIVKKGAAAKILEFTPFQNVEKSGCYGVLFDGIRKMAAVVFNKVADWNGSMVEKKFVYGLDGSFCAADKVGGIPLDDMEKIASAQEPKLEDVGFFWLVKKGEAIATMPARIMYKGTDEDGTPFIKIAELSEGKERKIYVAHEYDSAFRPEGDVVFMGGDWNWATIKRASSVSDHITANEAEWPPYTVEIRNRGQIFSIHGMEVPEISLEGESLETFYKAASKHICSDDLLPLMKKAEENGSVFFTVEEQKEEAPGINKFAKAFRTFGPNPINLLKVALSLQPTKVELFKYAAEVGEGDIERTVDAILGLNFITEENIAKFLEKIADLEEARDVLAKTLLSARLGLQVNEGPVKTALFSLDSVIRQLHYLREYSSMVE